MDRPLCFVMMWMDKCTRDTLSAVRDVAQALGYDCRRMDEIQGVFEITAKIKDLIRESKALVADLRGAKPNVYYEIGYAHALGREVVLTAPTGESVEFDLRGVSTLYYDDLTDLKTRLEPLMRHVFGAANQSSHASPDSVPGEATDDLRASLVQISASVDKEPEDARLRESHAMVLQALGRTDEAAREFAAAIDLDPTEVPMYLSYAYLLNGLRRFEESLEVTSRALAIDPQSVRALCLRAYALNGVSRYEEAASTATKALDMEPRNAAARKHLETAESCIGLARGGTPKVGAVEEMIALGFARNQEGDHDAALKAFEEAVTIDPEEPRGHMGRGWTLNRLSRHQEALTAYDAAVALAPNHCPAHTGRGYTLNALQRFSEAAVAAGEALRLEPGNRQALSVLNTALQHSRRP